MSRLSIHIKSYDAYIELALAYLELTKPKVVLLMLLTVLVGMYLTPVDSLPMLQTVLGLLGIAALSASGAVFNHILDEHIDRKMVRTHQRPLPQHKVSTYQAVGFASSLLCIGFLCLYRWVNPLTAWLTLASLVGYAFVYTLYLKRATSQNIVIGGLAGAMPPLLGWTSIMNQVDPFPLLLVMIIFTWTPPHFWALAIDREKDYAKTGLPMLPVAYGIELTKLFILLYTILLMLVCLLPYLMNLSGVLYLVVSTWINGMFVYKAWLFYRAQDHKQAMPLFKFSIVHLMVLFVVLLLDHYGMVL